MVILVVVRMVIDCIGFIIVVVIVSFGGTSPRSAVRTGPAGTKKGLPIVERPLRCWCVCVLHAPVRRLSVRAGSGNGEGGLDVQHFLVSWRYGSSVTRPGYAAAAGSARIYHAAPLEATTAWTDSRPASVSPARLAVGREADVHHPVELRLTEIALRRRATSGCSGVVGPCLVVDESGATGGAHLSPNTTIRPVPLVPRQPAGAGAPVRMRACSTPALFAATRVVSAGAPLAHPDGPRPPGPTVRHCAQNSWGSLIAPSSKHRLPL